MARSFNGSSDKALTSGTPVTAAPFTMACWAMFTSGGVAQTMYGMGDTAAAGNMWSLDINASDNLRFRLVAAGSGTNVGATLSPTISTWFHAAAVETSSTSHAVFMNGGNKGTSTTSRAPAGADTIAIGCLQNNAAGQFFTGLVAEAALWNIALADADVASLAKGMSPLLMRPDALVAYWPLLGRSSPEPEPVGRYDLTLTGTAQAAHPKIFYPSRRLIIPVAAANVIGIGLTRSQRLQPRRLVA